MPSKLKRRNGHAFHPIMLKGGVHEKSKSAKRRQVKQEVKRQATEWLDRSSWITNSLTDVLFTPA